MKMYSKANYGLEFSEERFNVACMHTHRHRHTHPRTTTHTHTHSGGYRWGLSPDGGLYGLTKLMLSDS
jgi:hypothetical protein